ncbi:unnamed protein product, partial [marine sediment metagenome]
IAAANALSDVYAMGGEPLLAINLVAFPPELPEVLTEVLRGGAEKVQEAGVALAGGHTIQDKEPKYGLAHPDRLLTRAGARPGDALVLTKPLGTGVIVTAFKGGLAAPTHLAGAVRWMTALNRTAGRVAVELGLQGATDVTGFGLLGHGWEMAEASGVGMHIRLRDVPLMDGAREYAGQALFPGGSYCNRDFAARTCASRTISARRSKCSSLMARPRAGYYWPCHLTNWTNFSIASSPRINPAGSSVKWRRSRGSRSSQNRG